MYTYVHPVTAVLSWLLVENEHDVVCVLRRLHVIAPYKSSFSSSSTLTGQFLPAQQLESKSCAKAVSRERALLLALRRSSE